MRYLSILVSAILCLLTSSVIAAEPVNVITVPGVVSVPDAYSGVSYSTSGIAVQNATRNFRAQMPVVEGDTYNYLAVSGFTNTNAASTILVYVKLMRNGVVSDLGNVAIPKGNRTGAPISAKIQDYTALAGDAVFFVAVAHADASGVFSTLNSVAMGRR